MAITASEYAALLAWGRDFIDKHCIERRSFGNPLPGKRKGTFYTWMFYLRRGLYNAEFAAAVAKMFLYKVENEVIEAPFQLAGLESGAVPLLTGITLAAKILQDRDINVFSVRQQQKTYGLKNWIEGCPEPGTPVMLVDDLCNSSASMRFCHDACIQAGLPIYHKAFCLVNKVNKGVHPPQREVSDMYLPRNIEVISLYDLDDFNLSNPSH